MRPLISLFAVSSLMLAACATQTPATSSKHLVYRDDIGLPTMQFEYPSEDFCHQVEAIASRNATCQPQSAGDQLRARATLRYDPPGMLVEAQYADMDRCRNATSSTAPGVLLVKPCSAK